MNIVYFIGGVAGGFATIIYSKWITDNTSRIDFVEQYLGAGGTYSFWKLIGLILIGFGFYALFNM